jgi:hypothetical protein
MDTSSTWFHADTFLADLVSARHARAFVAACLVEHRVWHLVDPVRVVASELATSAILDGSVAFTMTLSANVEIVTLTLRRDGAQVPTPRSSPEGELLGPRRAIIEVLSRSWGVTTGRDGGREMWATFPAAARAAPRR